LVGGIGRLRGVHPVPLQAEKNWPILAPQTISQHQYLPS
jgi:hypothetical protein